MLDLLTLRHTQSVEHAHKPLRTEQPHKIVLQRDKELGLTRISLTSASATQLIVDTSGLMALRTDDLKAAGCSGIIIQLNIRTTSGHVGSDGHSAVHTGLSHDLRLQLMELGI